MSFSLYDAVVPSFLQMLDSLDRIVRKGEEHVAAQGLPPEALINARLAPDMLPFAWQVAFAVAHSQGALEGSTAGVCGAERRPVPDSFAALHERVRAAIAAIGALDRAHVNALLGKDVRFEAGGLDLAFTAENLLLSLAQPNLCFHVTTAYAIARAQGVPLGKRHYLGHLRTKP